LLAEQNKNTANGVLSKQNTEDNRKDDLNPENLDSEYRQLLGFLNDRPVAVDMLVEQSGLTVESVSSMLLILELQGYITAVPGGLFSRVKSEDG
jgi:DNA processing protein